MSSRYTTSRDRSRRRMATVIIIVGVVVLVGWIAAISALAGGSTGSQQGGAEGAANVGDGSGGEQAAPESTNLENNGHSSGEPTDQEPATEQGETPEGGQPPANSSADTQEVFDPLEESEPQQAGSTEGNRPEPDGGSTDTDNARARAASERYLTAAYGYTGDSSEEYLQAVEQAATEEIYDSPGGSMLKGYSRAAPECGMRSTVILEEFEMVGQSPEGLDVAVTFSVEDADGQTHTFRQDQRLIASGEAYEVSAVSVEELISQTTPKESCPGAQSSDASSRDASSDGSQDKIKPDSIGVADEDRVRSAADRYITSAYGYTGDSGEEYRGRVDRTVDEETFYSSPGGEQVREYARAAEEDGITAAAVMEGFEITSTGSERITGTAYFRVGSSYDRYGELEGEGKPFSVDLTLSAVSSTYEVSEASLEREVSAQRVGGPQEKKTS